MFGQIIAILLSLAAFILAPTAAQKLMGLKGGSTESPTFLHN